MKKPIFIYVTGVFGLVFVTFLALWIFLILFPFLDFPAPSLILYLFLNIYFILMIVFLVIFLILFIIARKKKMIEKDI